MDSIYCEAAQDNYRKVKTENEVLKEKVDVLFKLGRSYINKSKQSTKFDDASHSTQDTATEEEIVIDDTGNYKKVFFHRGVHRSSRDIRQSERLDRGHNW